MMAWSPEPFHRDWALFGAGVGPIDDDGVSCEIGDGAERAPGGTAPEEVQRACWGEKRTASKAELLVLIKQVAPRSGTYSGEGSGIT